mgnify:CR=1 FL=1
MNTQMKYIIKHEKTGNFYNFITNSWIKNLTLGCLTTAGKVFSFCGKLKDIKIKKYSIKNFIPEKAVDIILEI